MDRTTLLYSLFSLLVGFISGLITPWVKWKIEKKRIQTQNRMELVKQWIKGIEKVEESELGSLPCGDKSWYSSLRLHMNEEVIKTIERPRTLIVPNEGRTGFPVKQKLLDEVARIEREWRLI